MSKSKIKMKNIGQFIARFWFLILISVLFALLIGMVAFS
jgi:hypothetical protein